MTVDDLTVRHSWRVRVRALRVGRPHHRNLLWPVDSIAERVTGESTPAGRPQLRLPSPPMQQLYATAVFYVTGEVAQ